MKRSILALSCAMGLVTSAFAGTGDFNITNNTSSYGTIKIGYYPCSSMLGSSGIIKPHETHVFTHSAIKSICGSSCSANFFPTNNCTGKIIGTAKIDPKVGVMSFTNSDEAHYNVTGSGFDYTINEVASGLRGWLKRFF